MRCRLKSMLCDDLHHFRLMPDLPHAWREASETELDLHGVRYTGFSDGGVLMSEDNGLFFAGYCGDQFCVLVLTEGEVYEAELGARPATVLEATRILGAVAEVTWCRMC